MITAGTILVQKGALRPECFEVEDVSFADGWLSVKCRLTPRELEKELSTAGWTFFYLATPIEASAFGFDKTRMTDAALKRVIAQVRQRNCNCLEIEGVEERSFLGIPFVSVFGHPRHIKKGMAFSGQAPWEVNHVLAKSA